MPPRWQTSDWLTAAELAELQLAGLPGTQRRVNAFAQRHGWRHSGKARRHQGRGGGWEYHLSLLPEATLNDLLARRFAAQAREQSIELPPADSPEMARALARAQLVMAAQADLGGGRGASLERFCQLYNHGVLPVSDAIRRLVPSISPASIRRWRKALAAGDLPRLANTRRRRAGRSPIDRANDGALARHVAALLLARPQLSAAQIRDLAIAEFGETVDVGGHSRPMPTLRSFQRWLERYRRQHAAAIARVADPDGYRSRYRHAGGSRDGWVKAVNDLWEIDASPADVMTTEGRASVYVCIDAHSRRMLVHVSRTPRTQAMLALVNRAIIEWGVPRVIRSDNGSDFTSHQARATFQALGIEHDVCPPFQPQRKGKVERAIRTLMHSFMPLLPGYVGHNVAERKQLEARKAFAQRLGQQPEKLLQVDMSMAELQQAIDRWVQHVYEHRPHKGLGGRTPFQVAAACTAPRRRVETPEALHLLAAPLASGGGLRTVGREGVRVNGHLYITRHVAAGQQVLVRHDPADMGRIWLFDPTTQELLDEAICPEVAGIDPETAHAAARQARDALVREAVADARAEARRLARNPRQLMERTLTAAERRHAAVLPFPPRAEEHTTDALQAAARATGERPASTPASQISPEIRQRVEQQMLAEWQQQAGNITPLPPREEEPDDVARFKRALRLERALAAGEALAEEDAAWLRGYQRTAEYRAQQRLMEDFPQLYGLAGNGQ